MLLPSGTSRPSRPGARLSLQTGARSRSGGVAEKPQPDAVGAASTISVRADCPTRVDSETRTDHTGSSGEPTITRKKEHTMRKIFELGGVFAALVLIVFGAVSIFMGIDGRSTVSDSLKKEQIVGTPDMTPALIKAEAQKAGLTHVTFPTQSVAGKAINSGERARVFAEYMRIHTLEATGGQVYSQMPRFATADGKGTNDPAKASKGPSGAPLDNPARSIWVTETALTTALNTSYMAEQVSLFSIVTGVAMLLAGLGFGILALGGALSSEKSLSRRWHVGREPHPVA
jgi:hypothetical protein